jgi:peptide/nickel transport system substrate-binding protein
MSPRRALVAAAVAIAVGVSVASSGAATKGHPSELRATFASFPDYMDPQLSYTLEGWTAMFNTYIPLLTYKHAGGIEGAEVIPGLAREMPEITDGGRTYTLFLRGGLKYSDGQRVRASDFEFAVKRMFRLHSGGSIFYTGIVGARRYARTKKGDIRGIEANDKTGKIVIHLVRPRGSFIHELALMFVAPVPPSTPASDQSFNPPPGTGPYAITSSKPGRSWSYARNPEWRSNNAKRMPHLPSGHFGKLHITVVRDPSAQVDAVEKGKFHWMQNPVPSNRLAEVERRYQGTQLRFDRTLSTCYFWMNTTRPPFDDIRVRQAVNYAVDTTALERIHASGIAPMHQILPEGMPGQQALDLYPYDLAKAKAMIQEARPRDRRITVWTDDESPNEEAGEYYEGVLQALGFEAELKVLSADNYFTIVGNRATADLDTGWASWYEDYPHPNDFFQPLLAGKSILPTNNGNFARIDVPVLNEEIAKLRSEQLGPEQEAAYAALDRRYMELAPWVPYGTRTLSTFVSSAIDLEKVIWSPTFGADLTSFQFD